jgi:hypothetical protein
MVCYVYEFLLLFLLQCTLIAVHTFLPFNVYIVVQGKFHIAVSNPSNKALVSGVWQVELQIFTVAPCMLLQLFL